MDVNRREFTFILTSAGLAGLAGCSGPSGGGGEQGAPDMKVAWPEVNSDQLDGWTETGRRKSSQSIDKWAVFTVDSYERTVFYEKADLRKEVKEETLGQFDQTLAMFFVSHINLEGTATSAAGSDEIVGRAASKMKGEMGKSGIKEIQQTPTQEPLPSVDNSTSREFRGYYPTPEITREVDIADVGTKTLKIESGKLPIAGILTAWKPNNGTAFAAGGAYPAQDFQDSGMISITSEKGDGIDATVSIDLGIRPGALRSEMNSLTESVGKSDEKA